MKKLLVTVITASFCAILSMQCFAATTGYNSDTVINFDDSVPDKDEAKKIATENKSTVSSSISSQAKSAQKYTDYPTLPNFGLYTDAKLRKIEYDTEDGALGAFYWYDISGAKGARITDYSNLLTALGYTDKGASNLDNAEMYSHVFVAPDGNVSVLLCYGYNKNKSITYGSEKKPAAALYIVDYTRSSAQKLPSISKAKAHEPNRYVNFGVTPDFGAYTNAKLLYVIPGSQFGTIYVYDRDTIDVNDLYNYAKLIGKYNFLTHSIDNDSNAIAYAGYHTIEKNGSLEFDYVVNVLDYKSDGEVSVVVSNDVFKDYNSVSIKSIA